MTPQQALEVLKQHQDWRTSKRDDCACSPQELTQALDIAIEVMEKHYRLSELILEKIERIEGRGLYRVGLKYGYLGALDIRTSLNHDKPEEK